MPHILLYRLFLPPFNLHSGGPSWKNPSKWASCAPDGTVSVLSGDHKSHAGKTKPIARWGRREAIASIAESY
jgi:hypothetical protein